MGTTTLHFTRRALLSVVAVLLAIADPVSAQITETKDSADFTYQYNGDTAPADPTLGGFGNTGYTALTFNNLTLGSNGNILDLPPTISGPDTSLNMQSDVWDSEISDATGFTWEMSVRLKTQAEFDGNGFNRKLIRVGDGEDGTAVQIKIDDDGDLNNSGLSISSTTDGQHVYRLAQAPNSIETALWVDGALLSTNLATVAPTPPHWWGDFFGFRVAWEIDYVRWEVGGFAAPGTVFPDPATDFTWDHTTGDWNMGGFWDPVEANNKPGDPNNPNNINHNVTFGDSVGSGSETVVTNLDVTVNSISFDNTMGGGYAIAGLGSVNLATGSDPDLPATGITVSAGTHEFQAEVALQDDAVVDIATGSTLEFANDLILNGNTLNKTGGGTLIISNTLNTGGGTVNAQAGVIGGGGTVGGDLTNSGGTISPGNSPGVLEVEGDFTQRDAGSLLSAGELGVVPEPGSLLLSILGMIALLGLMRPTGYVAQTKCR